MKRFSSRRPAHAVLALVALGASPLLTSCWEKDGGRDCAPKGSTCDVAATVVDLSKTTGCGLALHLADSTYVIPTGATWTNFHATAGQKVLVGYNVKKDCSKTAAACTAGPQVELGCISAVTPATTTTPAAK